MTEQDAADATDAEDAAASEATNADDASQSGETSTRDGEDAPASRAETIVEAFDAPTGDPEAWAQEAEPAAVVQALAERERAVADLAETVDELEAQLAADEDRIDELEGKLKRSKADFQNYKKRAEQRREEASERARAALLDEVLEVRDNLVRALDQDEDADIRSGVETTLRTFDDVLEAEGVAVVDPDPGAEVDPHRHEVLVRVDADQPEGTVADVHRPGYELEDTVVREAQVTVSEGAAVDDDGTDTADE